MKLVACIVLAASLVAAGQNKPVAAVATPQVITVRADRPGAAIAPTMFGLFFEDINFGADGGLYPERLKNRSFEFPDPLMGWKAMPGERIRGELQVMDRGEAEKSPNRHYLRLKAATTGYGVWNEGFRGIGLEKGAAYQFSFRARQIGADRARGRVVLLDVSGGVLAAAELPELTDRWKLYNLTLKPAATEARARFVLLLDGPGIIELDELSLFPQETWKGRKNGLRPDLVQLLADLKPGFLRFPGGCIVEGRHLETRYRWKQTVGEPAGRRLIVNRWNTEFRHRPTPDYYQSFGLGFYEYFQLSEDLGAEPLPILNCGMACQFNSAELVPLDALDPYVQDALDLIGFANGATNTRWGRLRASMGHPKPFNLKMIGIGNEQWGEQYIERYEVFARELSRRHPEVKLVSGVGPFQSGREFDYLWRRLRELKSDIVDEHYYLSPKWFRDNAGRYDNYPRSGPKVFAGEYAAQSVAIASPENRNNWECALSEAAFITGLERNAEVVTMSSYAPLLAHVDAWQWTPNLIWFDNLRAFGTPNYYVQKLFSTNRGDRVLPVLSEGEPLRGRNGIYASASRIDDSGEIILKLVNTADEPREAEIRLSGGAEPAGTARRSLLSDPDPAALNSLEEPRRIAPASDVIEATGRNFRYSLPARSFTVLRIPVRG